MPVLGPHRLLEAGTKAQQAKFQETNGSIGSVYFSCFGASHVDILQLRNTLEKSLTS